MLGDKRRPCMSHNRDLYSYLLTKVSWKPHLKRILSIGTVGITTYSKDLLRVTNQWAYREVVSVRPDRTNASPPRFLLTVLDTNRRKQELTFLSEFLVEVMTDILRFRGGFAESIAIIPPIAAEKWGWADQTISNVCLSVTPISIDQLDQNNGGLLNRYFYRDIDYIDKVIDLPGGLAIVQSGLGRMHIFTVGQPDRVIKLAKDLSQAHLALELHGFPASDQTLLSRAYCREYRLGRFSEEQFISQSEFVVQKLAQRHYFNPVPRLLCITENLLLERDVTSYRAISAYLLCEISALIRDRLQPQQFSVEFVRDAVKVYHSTDRDALLASLLDAVRANGNRDVYVSSYPTRRGLRFYPALASATEEIESVHLHFLRQPPQNVSFLEAVERFNANIAYSGLLHAVTQDGLFSENKERLINGALCALLTLNMLTSASSSPKSLPATAQPVRSQDTDLVLLEIRFHALRRLLASKAGFMAFTRLTGMRITLGLSVVKALQRRDDAVTHSVLDAINSLMQPMHDQPDIHQEQLNKSSIMSDEGFLCRLVDIFTVHALRGTGALVICALLDFFTFAVCLPYSETTDGAAFDRLLRLIANRGRALFRLFHHPSLAVVRGAGLVMRALIEEGGPTVTTVMQSLALAEGAVFHHLHLACFTRSEDNRSLAVRQLSRQLVALWTENNPDAQDLLKRMFPLGLLAFLESDQAPPVIPEDALPSRDNLKLAQEHRNRMEERKQTVRYQVEAKVEQLLTHWRLRVGLPARPVNVTKALEERPIFLRRPRHQTYSLLAGGKAGGANCRPPNWSLFYYQFDEDHAKPDLIWNNRTRAELEEAMDREIQEFKQERDHFSQSVVDSTAEDASRLLSEEPTGSSSSVKQDSQSGSRPSSEPPSPSRSMSDVMGSNSSLREVQVLRPASPTNATATKLISQVNLVSWNHSEFKVEHSSLTGEPRVGDYYLRLLLEEDKRLRTGNSDDPANNHQVNDVGLSRIRDSKQFFGELFRRYLQYIASGPALTPRSTANQSNLRATWEGQLREHRLSMRCLCLHAMAVVYSRCHQEIGVVSDIPLLVYLLDRASSASERDRLILLLNELMVNKYNVDSLVAADGVRVLIDLATLSHLHTSRCPPPSQSQAIKASAAQETLETGASTKQEWWWCSLAPAAAAAGSSPSDPKIVMHEPVTFNQLRQLVREKRITASTMVYAQGLDSRPRCRPDGFLADNDEDASSTSATGPPPSVRPVTGEGTRTSTWIPACRVVQLRWAIPELLGVSPVAKEATDQVGGGSSRNTTMNTGTEGVGSLVDQLGYSRGALMDYTTLAINCVRVMRKLCSSCSSRDPVHGGVVRPLPRPRKAISQSDCLNHLVLLLLTFDPPLVEHVVSLLHELVDNNPCLPLLYKTGVFFFILMYTGSNILPIARFLKDVHLLQAFRMDNAQQLHMNDLTSRSVLGNLLPDAMIAYLQNHPAEKFAEIYLGEFDSPEAIWNSEMRRFMIGRIASHLADFSPRLQSNPRAIYQYISIPAIVYPQLENELFCHNYYLRHLCDTSRFPNWPIRDPIALLRDILQAWRNENVKKPIDMSYSQAVSMLDLDPSQLNSTNEEVSIRRAYIRISIKHHPDKNPEGRDKFMAANAAYHFLCNRSHLSNGPNRLHIWLMLKAQCIVYSRYRSDLASQKYAGYPMLVDTIQKETEDDNLFNRIASSSHGEPAETSENAVLLVAAAELAYETIKTSALNAEELRRSGGIDALQEAFVRCSQLLSLTSSRPRDAVVQVCACFVCVVAAATQFPACRQNIHELPQLARHVLRMLYYKNLPQLCCLAASCVAAFSRNDYWLSMTCYEHGGLYLLLQHVFAYDFTLEEGGVQTTEASNAQVTLNRLALLSLWAIACLVSAQNGVAREATDLNNEEFDGITGDSPTPMEALSRLLTPHLARKCAELATTGTAGQVVDANDDPVVQDLPLINQRGLQVRQLAKLLTTNSVSPYLIWDGRCRADLFGMLEDNLTSFMKTGECDLHAPLEFTHSAFANELLIGEVFVRLYNKQPSFQLDNSHGFVVDLLHFIDAELSKVKVMPPPGDLTDHSSSSSFRMLIDLEEEVDWSAETNGVSQRFVSHLMSSLEALYNVIRHNAGVELQCIGHFDRLFSIIDLQGYPDLQIRAIEVIQAVSVNEECLKDIAASELMPTLALLFASFPQSHQLLTETLDQLIRSTALLKQFVEAGGLIYLLGLLVGVQYTTGDDAPGTASSSMLPRQLRDAVVSLLSHCMADNLVGRTIQGLLTQYLPVTLTETLRDAPEAFLNLFDSDSENPELIWNSDFRKCLLKTVEEHARSFHTRQLQQRSATKWSLLKSFTVDYAEVLMRIASEHVMSNPGEAREEQLLLSSLGPVVVSGVYLHIYLASPGWQLRRPDVFLDKVLETWIKTAQELPESGLLLRLLTRACIAVLQGRRALLNALPRKGYLHQVIDLLGSITDPEGAKAAVLLLHQMSTSQVCVEAMADRETILGLLRVINCCIGDELGLVGETFFNIFNSSYSDRLIAQALKHNLIGYVLQLLHNGLPRMVKEPGQTCAYLVKALKAMQRSAVYGAQVTKCLEAQPNWADYRDQSHALFLSNTPQATNAYLTMGPASGSLHSSYLTAPPSRSGIGVNGACPSPIGEVPPAPPSPPLSPPPQRELPL